MTDPLTRFWSMLDAPNPRYHHYAFEWWPEGKREQFQRLGYLIPAGESAHVRCPECRTHAEEVVVSESPQGKRFFITCPEYIRVEVTHEDRRVWTPDFGGVARGIAQALRLRGSVQPIRNDRVWCCGRMDWHGREPEVVFACGHAKKGCSIPLWLCPMRCRSPSGGAASRRRWSAWRGSSPSVSMGSSSTATRSRP